jgi:hypothetical protein
MPGFSLINWPNKAVYIRDQYTAAIRHYCLSSEGTTCYLITPSLARSPGIILCRITSCSWFPCFEYRLGHDQTESQLNSIVTPTEYPICGCTIWEEIDQAYYSENEMDMCFEGTRIRLVTCRIRVMLRVRSSVIYLVSFVSTCADLTGSVRTQTSLQYLC